MLGKQKGFKRLHKNTIFIHALGIENEILNIC